MRDEDVDAAVESRRFVAISGPLPAQKQGKMPASAAPVLVALPFRPATARHRRLPAATLLVPTISLESSTALTCPPAYYSPLHVSRRLHPLSHCLHSILTSTSIISRPHSLTPRPLRPDPCNAETRACTAAVTSCLCTALQCPPTHVHPHTPSLKASNSAIVLHECATPVFCKGDVRVSTARRRSGFPSDFPLVSTFHRLRGPDGAGLPRCVSASGRRSGGECGYVFLISQQYPILRASKVSGRCRCFWKPGFDAWQRFRTSSNLFCRTVPRTMP